MPEAGKAQNSFAKRSYFDYFRLPLRAKPCYGVSHRRCTAILGALPFVVPKEFRMSRFPAERLIGLAKEGCQGEIQDVTFDLTVLVRVAMTTTSPRFSATTPPICTQSRWVSIRALYTPLLTRPESVSLAAAPHCAASSCETRSSKSRHR